MNWNVLLSLEHFRKEVILIEECLHVIGSCFIVTLCIILTNNHTSSIALADAELLAFKYFIILCEELQN